jgi:hypothetical protein
MSYHHTQRGLAILLVCLTGALLLAALMWRTGALLPLLVSLIIVLAVATIFSSLTVEMSGNELRWYFGPGLWTHRLALDEIQTVEIVRNRWISGFGIRMRPGFRLYNVSGLDAVELKLKSGEIRRIGTDDPQGLAAALKSARGDR